MKLNPKTAAKQFLRKQENRTAENRKLFPKTDPNAAGFVDKWGTGGKIIRSAMKQFQIAEEYYNRIAKIRKVKYTDGSTRDEVQLVDSIRNTNKFTNGLA